MADSGLPRSRISLLIEYIAGGNGNIDYGSTAATLNGQGNDLSNPSAINTASVGGIRPFIWGVSRIGSIEEGGDGHHFWSDPTGEPMIVNGRQVGGRYNGFWGIEVSDENGEFDNSVTFQIIGENIDKFVIRFDQALNEFATVVNVDGKDYENTGEFVWTGVESNAHYVTIKKWNKPTRQVKITSILIGLVVEYDRRYFQKNSRVVAGSRRILDNTKPFYGVANQYGSFRAIDIDRNFEELSQVGLLIDGLRCGVFMNAEPFIIGTSYDNYKKENESKMLGDYRLAEVSFIGDIIEAELVDDILNWGTIYQSGVPNREENTALSFLTGWNYTENGEEKHQNGLLDFTPNEIKYSPELEAYFESIKIPDGYIPPSMLDAALSIFGWATLTRLSKDTSGNIWLTK